MTKLVPIFVQNRLTGVYAIMKPLEKSERIENMLKESEKRLRTLVNSMPAFVIFKDVKGAGLRQMTTHFLASTSIMYLTTGKR